jgi:hypothetical protein
VCVCVTGMTQQRTPKLNVINNGTLFQSVGIYFQKLTPFLLQLFSSKKTFIDRTF